MTRFPGEPEGFLRVLEQQSRERQERKDRANICPKCGSANHTEWCMRRSYCLTAGCGATLHLPDDL